MKTPTEQNILKGCGKEIDDETICGCFVKWGNEPHLCPSCKKLLEGYQLAQKENQNQPQIRCRGATNHYEGLVKPSESGDIIQKYKKETAEKVEKLKEEIKIYSMEDGEIHNENVFEIIDKIFKDNTKKEAEK